MSNSRIRRETSQFPAIPGRFKLESFKDVWNKSLTKSTPRSPTQPIRVLKNFFLPPESKEQSPITSKTPTYFAPTKSKPNERRLQELNLELDEKEITYQSETNFLNISSEESLFYAYCSYLEGLAQCVMIHSHVYRSYFTRAQNGLIGIFRKMFSRLKQSQAKVEEISVQTLLTIDPTKTSELLARIGDIINDDLSSSEKAENVLQSYIQDKKRMKFRNTGTQTVFKKTEDGVIEIRFKTYEELENELSFVREENLKLLREKKIFAEKAGEDSIEQLVNRNKALESMVIAMRNSQSFQDITKQVISELDDNHAYPRMSKR
jgi:hypothetical protein